MRELIKGVVSDLATHIYECGDGSDALALYTEHRPDWVLMDIEMAEVDGLVATRQIKQVFPDANIMIITNYNDTKMRQAAQQAGASAYILKEDLLAVRHLLGG